MRLVSGDFNPTALTPLSVTISLVTIGLLCIFWFGECVLIGFLTKRSNYGNLGNISFTGILLALKRAVLWQLRTQVLAIAASILGYSLYFSAGNG
jgi:hypothetical protein